MGTLALTREACSSTMMHAVIPLRFALTCTSVCSGYIIIMVHNIRDEAVDEHSFQLYGWYTNTVNETILVRGFVIGVTLTLE